MRCVANNISSQWTGVDVRTWTGLRPRRRRTGVHVDCKKFTVLQADVEQFSTNGSGRDWARGGSPQPRFYIFLRHMQHPNAVITSDEDGAMVWARNEVAFG